LFTSGFKSQWIIFDLFNTQRASSNWDTKTLTKFVDKPLNWFCLINSYKLTLSISNIMHKCPWNINVSFNLMILCLSSLSYWLFNFKKIYLLNKYNLILK